MGLYQVVLGSNMNNFPIYFEIDVEESQHSTENNTKTKASQKEENFIIVICLGSYGGILNIFLIIVSWKYYKGWKSAKQKGKVLGLFICLLFMCLFVYYLNVSLIIIFAITLFQVIITFTSNPKQHQKMYVVHI